MVPCSVITAAWADLIADRTWSTLIQQAVNFITCVKQ